MPWLRRHTASGAALHLCGAAAAADVDNIFPVPVSVCDDEGYSNKRRQEKSSSDDGDNDGEL